MGQNTGTVTELGMMWTSFKATKASEKWGIAPLPVLAFVCNSVKNTLSCQTGMCRGCPLLIALFNDCSNLELH